MFVKNPKNKSQWLWQPKSPDIVKRNSTDHASAKLALNTPTSTKQSIVGQHLYAEEKRNSYGEVLRKSS